MTIGRMVSFFARHDGNQEGGEDDAGYIAWLLWGGDAGRRWANSIWKREKKKTEKSQHVPTAGRVPRAGQLLAQMTGGTVAAQELPAALRELAKAVAAGAVLTAAQLHQLATAAPQPALGGDIVRTWAKMELSKANPAFIPHPTSNATHFIERFPTQKLRVTNNPEAPHKPELRRMPTGMIRIYATKEGTITRRQKQPDGSWRQVQSLRISPKGPGKK